MAPKKPVDPSAASQSGSGDGPEPGFEESLERLESIVEDLEAGALTLEESIARYEEGMRLSRRLTQTLDEAEKRIERLISSENGEPTTRPVDLDAEEIPTRGMRVADAGAATTRGTGTSDAGASTTRGSGTPDASSTTRDSGSKRRQGSGGAEELPF